MSQDFAAGHMAEQGRNGQGFLENGQAHPVERRPSGMHHALQDYMMQLMLLEEKKPGANRALQANVMLLEENEHGGNHALQEYQMQLMLLEQQKKKRIEEQKQGRETHSLKRPRVDTQAEQSCNNSSSTPMARKNRRRGAAGENANTEPVDKNPQQAHISSATAVNQDTIG